MVSDSLTWFLSSIKNELEILCKRSFNGKIVIEVSVKDGGITGGKFIPHFNIVK